MGLPSRICPFVSHDCFLLFPSPTIMEPPPGKALEAPRDFQITHERRPASAFGGSVPSDYRVARPNHTLFCRFPRKSHHHRPNQTSTQNDFRSALTIMHIKRNSFIFPGFVFLGKVLRNGESVTLEMINNYKCLFWMV